MFPRRVRIRTSPAASAFGGVAALVFVGLGIFVVIPMFGPFGVVWTLLAVAMAIFHFYNAFSSRGIASEIIEVTDGGDLRSDSVESRLRQLDDLKAKGLITPADHERRKTEILREI